MTYDKNNIEFAPLPTAHNFRDLTGMVFTRLTVLGFARRSDTKKSQWWCECICGTVKTIQTSHLISGGCKSCGCLRLEALTHGEILGNRQSTEYKTYYSAIQRCTNPNHTSYKNYGAKGIEFRFTSFTQFLEHLGRKPTPLHTLERIDNRGHYEQGNVKWATQEEQMYNVSSNRNLTVRGVTKCVAEWAKHTQKRPTTIFKRLLLGYCDECAVTLPFKGKCPHRLTTAPSVAPITANGIPTGGV